jgi:hypothetical protein
MAISVRETMQPEAEFVAFVGIDWGDQKRVGSLQAAHCTRQPFRKYEHRRSAE